MFYSVEVEMTMNALIVWSCYVKVLQLAVIPATS